MKKLAITLLAGFAITMIGCGKKSPTDIIVTPPDTTHHSSLGNVVVFDDFNDGDVQNSVGAALGHYKMANMSDTGKDLSWGGGQWYAWASTNGAKVVSGNGDTILNGTQSTTDDPNLISKLMIGGRLQVELNCQNVSTVDYWAGVGCDIAGDPQHPFKFDSLKFAGDSTIYWDLSGLDSIKITMSGDGSVLFYLESQAVKSKFATPDDAWGYHGFTRDLTSATDQVYSIPVSELKTNPGATEASSVTWDQAKTAISGFAIELNTDSPSLGDFLDLSIDKIEFVFRDSTVVPFNFR
jgi:hypothetical protein